MIKNGLFTTSILIAGTAAACFFGCSSQGGRTGGAGSSSGGTNLSASSSGGSGGGDDGGSSGSGSSGGSGQSGADSGACMAPSSAVPDSDVPPYAPVVAMTGSCTMMQINGFVSGCVAQGATGSSCSSWANSNGNCAACIVQGTDAGPTQTGAILFNVMNRPVSGNVPGCIALEDQTGGPACAQALEPVFQCVDFACASCTDQRSFTACEMAAKAGNGACGAYASAAQMPCATDLGSSGVGVTKCGYGTGNELVDVINVICGSGP